MACFQPLKGFPIGFTVNGKVQYKITGYSVDHVELYDDHVWRSCPDDSVSRYARKIVRDCVDIPCGRCIGCRLDYSRRWADRIVMESKYHDHSYFLTLTYDEDHIPYSSIVDDDSGEVLSHMTLCKRDLQLFLKRLRKAYPDSTIRYYACGEYGSSTYRPHYHMCLFGPQIDDLRRYKVNFNGDALYTSEKLSSVWKKGYVVIGELTWDSAAYTARYIMKKAYGDAKKAFDLLNIQSEFTTMSLKPAIGRQYFDDHKEDMYRYGQTYINTEKGSHVARPSVYFDRLYDSLCPGALDPIKKRRKAIAESNERLKLSRTSLDKLSYLAVEEEHKRADTRALKRFDI